jgi:hypothetical protein
MEYEDLPEKDKKRVHFHIVMNFPDRDIAESLWHGGARTQSRRLQPDDCGLTGLAEYVTKNPKGTKRYVCSKNLKKPDIETHDYEITRRRARQIATNYAEAEKYIKKLKWLADYKFVAMKTYLSDITSGAYIYIRLRKKDIPKNYNRRT